MISATQIREGNVILYRGAPHRVLDFQHRAPGKGAAFVRVLLRNLETGSSYEHRFSSGEQVERAMLDEREMDYLYHDGNLYHFMDTETFEQTAVGEETLGEFKNYLKEGQRLQIHFFDGDPIGIIPPKFIELEVAEAEPELKGATASSSSKPATLETGVVVQVPPFIDTGEKVRIDSVTGEYLERAK